MDNLRDIHLPNAIGWWPMAWGKMTVMVLVLGLFFWFTFVLVRRYMRGRPRRMALKLLATYEKEYHTHHNSEVTSAGVSELLKRVALAYFPRARVASLHGEDWIEFLSQTSRGLNFIEIQATLLEIPFKPSEQYDLSPLFKFAKAWVKERRRHV